MNGVSQAEVLAATFHQGRVGLIPGGLSMDKWRQRTPGQYGCGLLGTALVVSGATQPQVDIVRSPGRARACWCGSAAAG